MTVALLSPRVVGGRVGVLPARPCRAADTDVVRVEGRVGAPAPWDPLDDGEDYDPRAQSVTEDR